MISDLRQRIRRNWFQLLVLLLLVLCYIRLGHIEENAFYTADMVDSSATRIINSDSDYLDRIERNTELTFQILDDRLQ